MLPQRVRRLFRLDRGAEDAAADVDRELEHHFAAAVEDLVRRGVEPGEARRIAEQRFGNVQQTRAALIALATAGAERRRRVELRADWWLDVRHALRGYVATPGVTFAVVTMLALGIGANAAMYGILSKLLIQPPPHITSPESILRLYVRQRDAFTGDAEITHEQFDFAQFSALQRDVSAFAELTGYSGPWPEKVGHGQETQQVAGETITGNFFAFLGVGPLRGRLIEPADDRPGAPPAAVISYGYWQRHFGGRDAALGATLDIGRTTYTVIGVAPRGFSGPGVDAPDVWLPAQIVGPAAGSQWRYFGGLPLRALVRLKPGATPAVAAQQATAVLRANYATTILPPGAHAPPLGVLRVLTGPLVDPFGPLAMSDGLHLSLLVGGVALILLIIACANVANLLLLRAATRRRELAVRSALGAGRWRVVRMLLIESTILALAAGAAAIAVATITGRILRVALLPAVQWATGVLDLRVLLFAGLAALALGVVTGAPPAIQARRGAGVGDLRAGVRAARRHSTPVRAGLLVLQSALALVLVAGAGAFYLSLEKAGHHDPGYALDHLLTVNVNHPDPADRSPLPEEDISTVADRVRHLAGVTGVAQTTNWSVLIGPAEPLSVPGIASLPRMPGPFMKGVTPNFFDVVGLPILRGRGFSDADRAGAPSVAVVNTAMARAIWPAGEPLGACLYVGRGSNSCTTVVGVAGAEAPDPRSTSPLAQYYVPLAQYASQPYRRVLVVRARDDPRRLIQPILGIMAGRFPSLPRERVAALRDLTAPWLRPWRMGMGLFGAAAGLALFLAAMGLYAMIAYGVRQREHEFGIRRALGAQVSDLARLVILQTVTLAVPGLLLGAAAVGLSARSINPLLYPGLSAHDPTVLVPAATILLAACLAAGIFPARNAGRADPRAALQAE